MDINSCGVLETPEIAQLCNFLSSQIGQLRTLPWITGVLGLAGGLIVALVTTMGTRSSQKTERFNRAQRDALTAVQNVALKLRSLWLAYYRYVESGRVGENPFPDDSQTKILGKFDTAVVRLDNDHLRRDYREWSEYAQELFSGAEDCESHEENRLWVRAVECSGSALRRLDK